MFHQILISLLFQPPSLIEDQDRAILEFLKEGFQGVIQVNGNVRRWVIFKIEFHYSFELYERNKTIIFLNKG